MTPDGTRQVKPLANRHGIELVVGLLLSCGAMCPTCGHGTRATSKRWATCKQCGQRVQRHEVPPRPKQPTPTGGAGR